MKLRRQTRWEIWTHHTYGKMPASYYDFARLPSEQRPFVVIWVSTTRQSQDVDRLRWYRLWARHGILWRESCCWLGTMYDSEAFVLAR
jgi:hypothetical protein